MAVAVIGGLASSTLLSLISVPAVFSGTDAVQRRAGRLLARMFSDKPDVIVHDRDV